MLRLTEDEKKLIEQAAKAKHLDTAVYVRQVVLRECERQEAAYLHSKAVTALGVSDE